MWLKAFAAAMAVCERQAFELVKEDRYQLI